MKEKDIRHLVRESIRTILEMNPAEHSRNEKEAHPEKYCPDGKCLWKTQTSKGFNPCKKHPHLMPKPNTSATPEQPNKEPQDSVPVAQAGSTNAPAPKSDPKSSEDTEASEQAKQLGLTHAGWGNYKDASGKVVARSIDGKLVKIEKKQAGQPSTATKEPTADTKAPSTAAPAPAQPSTATPQTPTPKWAIVDKQTGTIDKIPGYGEEYMAQAKAKKMGSRWEVKPISSFPPGTKFPWDKSEPKASTGTVDVVAGQKFVNTADGKVVNLAAHFDVFPPDLKAGDKVSVQYKSTGSKGYHVVTPVAAEPKAAAPASPPSAAPKSTALSKEALLSELNFLKKATTKLGVEKTRELVKKLAEESKDIDHRRRGMRLEAVLDVLQKSWRDVPDEQDAALTAFLEQRGLEKVVPQGSGGPGIHPGWNKARDVETAFDANADETVQKLLEMFKGNGPRLLRWLYKKLLTATSAGKERLGQYIGILMELIGPDIGTVNPGQTPLTP
jgi:hypothetical protein